MNLGELRSRVYARLRDDPNDNPRFTVATINRLINDAYIDMVEMSGVLEDMDTIPVTASTGTYTMRADMNLITRVAFDGWPIEQSSHHEMDRITAGWEDHTGTPVTYMLSDRNEGTIRLHPAPSATGGVNYDSQFGVEYATDEAGITYDSELGVVYDSTDDEEHFSSELGVSYDSFSPDNALEVWGRITPDPLAEDSESPRLPGYAHIGIVYLAVSRAYMFPTELRSKRRSEIYGLMADESVDFLRRMLATRTPERHDVKGERHHGIKRRRKYMAPFNNHITT